MPQARHTQTADLSKSSKSPAFPRNSGFTRGRIFASAAPADGRLVLGFSHNLVRPCGGAVRRSEAARGEFFGNPSRLNIVFRERGESMSQDVPKCPIREKSSQRGELIETDKCPTDSIDWNASYRTAALKGAQWRTIRNADEEFRNKPKLEHNYRRRRRMR